MRFLIPISLCFLTVSTKDKHYLVETYDTENDDMMKPTISTTPPPIIEEDWIIPRNSDGSNKPPMMVPAKNGKGQDFMIGDLLKRFAPKDLKGFLNLLNGVVPGVTKLEPEIKSVAKSALPLVKKVPDNLEEKTPTIREYTKAVWNGEEISDEQRLKWAKEVENDEGFREVLQLVHDNAASIKKLLKLRKDVEKKVVDFVTPIIGKDYSALIPKFKRVAERWIKDLENILGINVFE